MEGYIVNGVPVSIAMYPFMALITRKGRVHCGGFIISNYVIVTAAHCFFHGTRLLPYQFFKVYLGSEKVYKGTEYDVCGLYPHERYENDWFTDDIGLMLLSNNIIFGPTVQKARLPMDNWRKQVKLLSVIGFGTLTTEGPVSNTLQMTVMKYMPNEICDRTQGIALWKKIKVPPEMFCMIGEKWTSDCYGDSGGPVITRGFVVGIVNIGRDAFCGSDMIPSMYLDIYQYKDWLSTNINKIENNNTIDCVNSWQPE